MTAAVQDAGAPLGQWNAVIRRAQLPSALYTAALTISSYADADGRNIRCGVARLAVDLDVGYSTARRYLATLRRYGLIELVARGNSYRRQADVYRLTLGLDTLEHIAVLTPAEYDQRIEAMRESNRAGEKSRRLRSPKPSADPVDNVLDLRSHLPSAELEVCAQSETGLRSPVGERPPSTRTLHQPQIADDVTTATVPGDRAAPLALVDGFDLNGGVQLAIATPEPDLPPPDTFEHVCQRAIALLQGRHPDWQPETVTNVLRVAGTPMYGSRSLEAIDDAWRRFVDLPTALLHAFVWKSGAWWKQANP